MGKTVTDIFYKPTHHQWEEQLSNRLGLYHRIFQFVFDLFSDIIISILVSEIRNESQLSFLFSKKHFECKHTHHNYDNQNAQISKQKHTIHRLEPAL